MEKNRKEMNQVKTKKKTSQHKAKEKYHIFLQTVVCNNQHMQYDVK